MIKLSDMQAKVLFAFYVLSVIVISVLLMKDRLLSEQNTVWYAIAAIVFLALILITRKMAEWVCDDTCYRTLYVLFIIVLFILSSIDAYHQTALVSPMTVLFYILISVLMSALYGTVFDTFAFVTFFVVALAGSIIGYYEIIIVGKEAVDFVFQ